MDRPSRILELDGLRGLAILMVFVFHAFWFPYHYGVFSLTLSGPLFWLEKFQLSLWIGVDLFFVLSGFLITRSLLDLRSKDKRYIIFAWRRVLRIFPAYLVLLLGWQALKIFYPWPFRSTDDFWAELSLWTFTANWPIAFHGWGRIPEPLAHAWTLAVEEQFYLVWPWVIFKFSKRNAFRLCVLLLFLCPLWRFMAFEQGQALAAYVLTPFRFDALAIGAALALAPTLPKSGWRMALSVVIGLLLAFFIWRKGLDGEDPPTLILGLTLISLSFAGLILQTLKNQGGGGVYKLLRAQPLVQMGKYSYGIYLLHQPVLLLLLFYTKFQSQVLFLGYGLVLSVLLAVLSYHLIEKQFLKLRN